VNPLLRTRYNKQPYGEDLHQLRTLLFKITPKKLRTKLVREKMIIFSYDDSFLDVSYVCGLTSYVFFFFFRLA